MMRAAEQCQDGTPHAGRLPCVLPYGAQDDLRQAAGPLTWARVMHPRATRRPARRRSDGCTRR
eukprot:5951543-Prymnesium_polylepis.1